MRLLAILFLTATLTSSVYANKQVDTDSTGYVESVSSVSGKGAQVNHDEDQYTDAEWAAFGITSEAPYIVKDGAVWRDMDSAESNAVNAVIQQEVTDKASAGVDMDALFQAIADAVKGNLKTKAEVKEAFKSGVDPKKEKKK